MSGNGYIGGIVGNNKGGLIEAAANEGNISADQQLAGGIAGYNTNGGENSKMLLTKVLSPAVILKVIVLPAVSVVLIPAAVLQTAIIQVT